MNEFEEAAQNFKNLTSNQVYNGVDIVYLKSESKTFSIHNGNSTQWLKFEVTDLPMGYDALIGVNKNDNAFYINIYDSFGNVIQDYTADPFIGVDGLSVIISINYTGDKWLQMTSPLGTYQEVRNKGSGFTTTIDASGAYTFTTSDATYKKTPSWVWVILVLIVLFIIFVGMILFFHFRTKRMSKAIIT